MFKTPNINQLPTFLKAIESKWISKRINQNRNRPANDDKQKPIYILSMFPYPSGRLHLGHARCYTSADILARFCGSLGKPVINPMGFDSFGLPAENAARERNLDPAVWTNANIRTMKKQLDDLGIRFDWREATSNPSYYKWTQDIFLKLSDANMIYKSYSKVNWDPIDKTVLADEQVDENGCSWRSGARVEKINCKQWFVKVSAFTNALYEATDVDPNNWGDILSIQRGWINKPNGYMFYLPIDLHNQKTCKTTQETLLVFVKKPESFLDSKMKLIISKDHWLNSEYGLSNVKHIQNPFNNSKLVIELAQSNVPLPGNCNATLGDNIAREEVILDTNSEKESQVNKTIVEEIGDHGIENLTRKQVLMQAILQGIGGYYTNENYRDWLISRQRFWGTPIPMINMNDGSYKSVPRSELPVTLPKLSLENNRDDDSGKQNVNAQQNHLELPLQKFSPKEWFQIKDPKTGEIIGTRDCETLDTMFDSSWYFLRYASEPNKDAAFNDQLVQPVWVYIGGKEHAYMHLFYARFMTHFLNSINELPFKEPFRKLLVQGQVKSKTYKLNGKYLSQDEISTNNLSDKDGKKLEINYEKMSKSKGNGVDPENLLEKYGIDATRLCLISYANPRSERLWRSESEEFKEVFLFLRRVILTVEEFLEACKQTSSSTIDNNNYNPANLDQKIDLSLKNAQNRLAMDSIVFIHETNEFRQYLSAMHSALNILRSHAKSVNILASLQYAKTLGEFLIILNPIVPHLSEELWLHFGKAITSHPRLSGIFLSDPTTAAHLYLNLHVKDQRWPKPDLKFVESAPEHKRSIYKRTMSSLDINIDDQNNNNNDNNDTGHLEN